MTITLDLPTPPSVNRTRKVNWAAQREIADWKGEADKLVLSQRFRRPSVPIERYELRAIFAEGRADLDNGLKQLIDYLRRIEVVRDDGPKHLRKLTVEFGDAPHGCRVEVVPI